MMKKIFFFALAASLAIGSAFAANTVFLTDRNGQVTFPISPPNRATGGPGAIDNMAIGATTPAAFTGSSIKVDTGTKTATAVTGAATLNKNSGTITTEALVTAAAGTYTLTLTNSNILATDIILPTLQNGTNTGGSPDVFLVTPSAGQVVFLVLNQGGTAFNGTLKLGFVRFAQ